MKRAVPLVLFLFFLLLLPGKAQAAGGPVFHSSLIVEEGRDGDVADLSLTYDGSLGPIGAFLVRVEYDPAAFTYVRTQRSPVLQSGYTTVGEKGNAVLSAYTLKEPGTCLEEAGGTFSYRFRVREGAEPGKVRFFISVYEITSPEPEALGRDTDETLEYTILPPPSGDASLRSLTPASGELVPAFSPELLSYRMTVPFEIREMAFTAEPAPGAYCRVNRKNLGAGGSETEFQITVTAEDGETKQVYRVLVRREEKAAASGVEKPTPTPKPAVSPKPEKTPKPTAPPRETGAASSQPKPTASPKPAPTASTVSQPAGPPDGGAGTSAGTGTPGGGEAPPGGPGNPTLIIQNGEPSLVPGVLAILFFLAVCRLSGPFATWWCKRFRDRPGGGEDGEQK